MTARRHYASTAQGTVLSSALGSTGNPVVTSLPGTWPSAYPYRILLDWGTAAQEAADVTSAPTGTGPFTLPCTRGVDGTTAQAHASGAMVLHGITGQDFGATASGTSAQADYVILLDGTTVICAKTADGTAAYSGSDGGAALSAAISGLSSAGGLIAFQAGTYTWSTVPQLPPGLPELLTITGHGAKISLTSSAPRFLDFQHSPAAGASFQNIWLEGFHVDASGFTWSGHHHVILGTMVNNDFTTGTNVSFANITVRNIRGTGGVTTTLTTSTAEQRWVCFQSQDSASGQTNTGNNITVENLDLTGGSYGIECCSYPNTVFYTGDPGFTWDNIRIRNIRHDIGSDPDVFQSYAHVQVGARGIVKTCWIENIWGRGSRDVAIEIDNAVTAYVRDCWFRNCHGLTLDITNYLAPANVHEQAVYISGITRIRDAGTAANQAATVIGIASSQNRAGTFQAFGRVICRDITCFADGTSCPDLVTQGISGELLAITCQPDEVYLEGGTYYGVNLAQTSTTTAATATAIYAHNDNGPSQRTKLTLKDIDITMSGSNASASFPVNVRCVAVSGWDDVTIDNVSTSVSFTTPGSFAQYGMAFGELGAATVQGTIRRYRAVANNDTGGRGIVFYTADKLTVPNAITIEDCDFSGMTGGTEIVQGGSGSDNKARVFAYRNRWRTFPKIAYTITAPASGTGQQYLEFWRSRLNLSATTSITAVQVSRDGTTYYDVMPVGMSGTITKAAVPLICQGEYFKVTYTGTLTVTVIPES